MRESAFATGHQIQVVHAGILITLVLVLEQRVVQVKVEVKGESNLSDRDLQNRNQKAAHP